MDINIILTHKEFQPEVEGMQFSPESYMVNITRSDGRGISKTEAQVVLSAYTQGLDIKKNLK